MKNSIKILLIFICLISVACITYSIYMRVSKEYYVTDQDSYYEDTIEYLKNELNNIYSNEKDYQIFTSYKNFAITEKMNSNYVYIWINIESYFTRNNKLYQVDKSSYPYKFTIKNGKVIKYERADTSKDIKKIMLKDIQDEVLNFNIESLSLNDEVLEHYSYLEDKQIYTDINDYDITIEDLKESKIVDYYKNYDDTYGILNDMYTQSMKLYFTYEFNNNILLIKEKNIKVKDVKGYLVFSSEGIDNLYILMNNGKVYYYEESLSNIVLLYDETKIENMSIYIFNAEQNTDSDAMIIGIDTDNKYINLREIEER